MINTNSDMFQKMKDEEYHDLYIASQAKNGIAFQIRALRAARQLKQDELAELAETKQTAISRIENRTGGYPNVGTLLKLAKAFKVALVVRFEPIDRYLDWLNNLSPEDMAPLRSAEILEALEREAGNNAEKASQQADQIPVHSLRLINTPTATAAIQTSLVFDEPSLVSNAGSNAQTPASGSATKSVMASSNAGFSLKAAI